MNQVAHRELSLALSAVSAGAMLYIGLYQSRIVERMWCPLNGKGCEAVLLWALWHRR